MSIQNRLSQTDSSTINGSAGGFYNSLKDTWTNSALIQFWSDQWKALSLIVGVFLACYYLP
ncbi:MAG: hypothetical protein AB7V04_10100, partial [Desulfomonilaceae bacterium]